MDAHLLVQDIAEMEWIDRFAVPTRRVVQRIYEGLGRHRGPTQDFLRGKFLGHPLHPATVHVPLGAWTVATLLDIFFFWSAAGRVTAEICVGIGLLAAIPSVLAGLTDWEPYDDVATRRIGALHGLFNFSAFTLYSVSFLFRLFDVRIVAVATSLWAFGALIIGGYLGGLLVYEKGIGSNHAPEPEESGAEGPFKAVCAMSDLVENKPKQVHVDDLDMAIILSKGTVYALADRCAHQGAPLSEGEVQNGCIVCPWHHSTFRLSDGDVMEGPSVFNQPTYPVLVQNGRVCVRVGAIGPAIIPEFQGRAKLL